MPCVLIKNKNEKFPAKRDSALAEKNLVTINRD